MLLLDKNNNIIGRYLRPVTTSVVFVQLGIYRDLGLGDHPEVRDSLQQVQMLRMERIEICDIKVLRINEDIPADLFQHEGFKAWTGRQS